MGKILDAMPDTILTNMWNNFDWAAAEQELLTNQQELVKAVYAGNDKARILIQKRIVRSNSSKMLAVRHVCSVAGSRGTDGVKWTTPAEMYKAAMSLTSKDYKASPYRHIVIDSKTGKKRHINIPTYYDKAMQTLYGYSLNPVAEAYGERKSFAFRKGRSMQDANEYIKEAISGKDAHYVIKTDVKSCYASISHKWLIENIPMDTRVLKEFLTAGYIFAGELFPTEDYGISLGSNISPILGNMTLDGMQKHIYASMYPNGDIDFPNGNLIRFADDILITTRTKEDANLILQYLSEFLSERGLVLSETKTKIIAIEEGFDFLARHYTRKNGIVSVTPADYAITRFENELEDLILNHKGSQKALIDKLNQKLTGWATYHRVSDAYDAFRRIDVFVKANLLKLCQTKHPSWPNQKIMNKYWFLEYNGEYVYALKDRADIRVKKLADTLLIEHKKIKTNANAYLDSDYIEDRTDSKEIYSVTGKYKAIWTRQEGICYYCGKRILIDHQKTIVPIDPSKRNSVLNLAYVHQQCAGSVVEYAFVDTLPTTENDIINLIETLDKPKSRKGLKFAPLDHFFQRCTQNSITLTFKEIEEIIETPLCKSAHTKKQYWQRTGDNCISNAWLRNGYFIQRLHLDKKRIVFHKAEKKLVPVEIPEVFLSGRIPDDAKFELENYFAYIRKKYGL